MIALDCGIPAYRGSRGHAMFVLPSGQQALIHADDKQVVDELKRRHLWQDVDFRLKLGQGFILAHETASGLDFFLWFGQKEDGGFLWYAFPGAHKETPEVQDFWIYLTNQIFGVAKPMKMEKPAR
jgi:hypothetical protein